MSIKFVYVTDNASYIEALNDLSNYPSLAADTETYVLPQYRDIGMTSALDPHSSRISIFILKGRKGKTYILDIILLERAKVDFNLLRELLETRDYTLWWNAKFDLKMMRSTFGWMPENIRCGMILAKLIGNATGSKVGRMTGYSYAGICRDLFNIHLTGKSTDRTSSWFVGYDNRTLENDWWRGKLEYAARDVKYLFAIEDVLLPIVVNKRPLSPLTPDGLEVNWGLGLKEVMEVEMEYVVSAAEIEYTGIGVSAETIKRYQQEVKKTKDKVAIELSRELGLDDPIENLWGVLEPTDYAKKILNSPAKILELIKIVSKLEKLDNTQTKVLKRMLDLIEKIYTQKTSEKSSEEDAEGLKDIFVNSTEDEVYSDLLLLEDNELLSVSPLIKKIITYKTCLKQEGMDLTKFISPITGRIHHNLITIGAATGRSSSNKPNLQQCSNKLPLPVKISLNDLWVSNSIKIVP